MKDAYSFDRDEASARVSYQKMYDAYQRIFTRCGLNFRAVEADNGMIGGSMSHEFMVLAETGEETILYDEQGTYAANVEQAEVLPPADASTEQTLPLEPVQTPGMKTVEDVCTFLNISPDRLVKTLLYKTPEDQVVAVLVRGDHEANEIKVNRVLATTELTLADPETVTKVTAAPVGFAGPVGLKGIRIVADQAVRAMKNFVVGGNANDTHLLNANWDRDFQVETFADLRQAQAGDPSPRTQTPLSSAKGIEVGHVFLLGTKYSQAMGATFLDEQGKETLAIMGCYGIGVSRIAAAAIEQNHDAKGMMWPAPIAPFHVHFLPVTASEKVQETTHSLYQELTEAGIEVLWDDRDERAGVKFNDADLIGSPYHVTIGDKGLAKGIIEIKDRRTGEVVKVEPTKVTAYLAEQLSSFQLPHI